MTSTTNRYSTAQRTMAWTLFLIGVAIAVVGNWLGWARDISWFDEAMHLYNAFAFTLLLAILLYGNALMGARANGLPLVLTIMLVGLGLGAVWEIIEWGYDQLFTQGSAIKGKTDTMLDLLLDAAGALAAGIVALRLAQRERAGSVGAA